MLVRIVAPHYVAGIIIENGVVVKAAPILFWSVNKPWEYVKAYFERNRYDWEIDGGVDNLCQNGVYYD